MNTKNKIAIGIAVGAVVITAGFVFRKQISRGLFGATKFNNKLANSAIKEWEAWGKGSVKEGDAATMERLRRYWREGTGVNWSDSKMTNEAWSAATISYLMKSNGAGSDFNYSTSHSDYIRSAIKNRKENNKNPFKGFKPEEVKIEKGDLLCYGRNGQGGYDNEHRYASHCDMAVDVRKGNANSIGGNVGNSVSLTRVPLTADGKIDKSKTNKPYFVVIKNTK